MDLTEIPSGVRLDPDKFSLVEIRDGFILATPKVASSPSLAELGSTGMSKYGSITREEYNGALRGQTGRKKYEQMRKSDGQVRAVLRLVKTPIMAARWYISPASEKKKDQVIAKFVNDCLTKYMSTSFPQLMIEILTMLEFGFSAFEKVWQFRDVNGTQRVVWQKLAQRHALDAYFWVYDTNGGPDVLVMFDPTAPGGRVDLPIAKLLAFTHEREGGDYDGVSLLRPAYKHWFYKEQLYKVDAIQKERHGIGIPVIQLPAGFTPDDRKLADEMGRNLRTNEKAHVVLPPNWVLAMLELQGNPVDAIVSIEHHDKMISREVLGQFLNLEHAGASAAVMIDLFMKSTRQVAETIRDVFNKYAIPELVNYNFPRIEDYPELRVRRIGDTQDWRTVSFALRNFVGAGVIIPDERLEDWVRDEMDLPPVEATGKRFVTPVNIDDPTAGQQAKLDAQTQAAQANAEVAAVGGQAKPTVPNQGTGRQAKAGNTQKTSGNNARAGVDKSGK